MYIFIPIQTCPIFNLFQKKKKERERVVKLNYLHYLPFTIIIIVVYLYVTIKLPEGCHVLLLGDLGHNPKLISAYKENLQLFFHAQATSHIASTQK